MEIIYILLVLSVLVIIHELGHYLVARWCGVRVEEFGLGYPPKAKTIGTWKGTAFTLNWIPFGGFVRMEGEDSPNTFNSDTAFSGKNAWQKLAIILAGAAVNFVFGVVAFAIVFSIMGIPVSLADQARIGAIQPDSPAQKAGLPTNVTIVSITTQDSEIKSPTLEQAVRFIKAHQGQELTLQTTGPCKSGACEESLHTYQTYARTEAEAAGKGYIGIQFLEQDFQFYPAYQMPFRGSWFGLQQAFLLGAEVFKALKNALVTGLTQFVLPEELSGPVGIVDQAQKNGVFRQGWLAVLGFSGMLSVNLAIMNVLPIPALDGGRAVFILLAPFIGKKRLEKFEGYIHYGGMVMLILLVVLISVRDVMRVVYGS